MKTLFFSKEQPVENDEGFVLITTLLLLGVLTVIAFGSLDTTTFEVKIAGNDKVAKINMYDAEAAAETGAQEVDNRDPTGDLDLLLPDFDKNRDDPDALLEIADAIKPFDDVENLNSNGDTIITMDDFAARGNPLGSAETGSAVVLLPTPSGDSLATGTTRQYTYASYGASNVNNGFVLIKVGFKKRF